MWFPIERAKPYPKNPRIITETAIAKVAAVIREFGPTQPIVLDEADEIIIGHTRRLAALREGLTRFPMAVLAGLTDAEKMALRIADNRTGEEAEWDLPKLAGEIAALRGAEFDLAALGFDGAELLQFGGGALPDLGDGSKPEFQQITFTLHNSQADKVKAALKAARAAGEFSGKNLNANGNALARVCEAYLAPSKRKRN